MKKRLYVMGSVALMSLVLAGCVNFSIGLDSGEVAWEKEEETRGVPIDIEVKKFMDLDLYAEQSYNFFFVCPNADNPYWNMVKEGIADADKYYGVHTETIGSNSLEEEKRYEYLKQAVACKPDGIFTPTFLTEEYQEYTSEIIEEGIPVIFVNSNVPAEEDNSQKTDAKRIVVGINDYEAGYMAGKTMIEATEGKARIGILSGADGEVEIYDRAKGFLDAIQDEKDMSVCVIETSDGSLELGMQAVNTMLRNYEINAVFGSSATDAIAAVQVIGEDERDITVIGFDNLDATLQYIEEGRIYATIMQNPYYMGWMGVQLLIQSLQEPDQVPQFVNVGTTLITKENVENYM